MVQARAAQHEHRLQAWFRTLTIQDLAELKRGSEVHDRVMELARSGATAVPPPPEFLLGLDEQDRRVAWFIEADPKLEELLKASKLPERIKAAMA